MRGVKVGGEGGRGANTKATNQNHKHHSSNQKQSTHLADELAARHTVLVGPFHKPWLDGVSTLYCVQVRGIDARNERRDDYIVKVLLGHAEVGINAQDRLDRAVLDHEGLEGSPRPSPEDVSPRYFKRPLTVHHKPERILTKRRTDLPLWRLHAVRMRTRFRAIRGGDGDGAAIFRSLLLMVSNALFWWAQFRHSKGMVGSKVPLIQCTSEEV